MRPIECKCFGGECGMGTRFLAYVPADIAERASWPPRLFPVATMIKEGGRYTCPKGHVNDERCVMGDGSDWIGTDIPIGTWSET